MPNGSDWVVVRTGQRVPGGETVALDAPLDGPPPLLARVGSGMLVDLAPGGWRPEAYRRGAWLFPQAIGSFAWEALEDAGDGEGPVDRWWVSGEAAKDRLVLHLGRDGPGTIGDGRITLLLPPGDERTIEVAGHAVESVRVDGRQGVEVRL